MNTLTKWAGRGLAVLFALPNVAVIAVWLYTSFTLRLPESEFTGSIYRLVLCGGAPFSILGLMIGLMGVLTGPATDRRWWTASIVANGVALFANCAGFVFFIAPGC